jgi:hypothetical protein
MHSSQPNGIFVTRNSNSPLGSRDQARGQDYSAWKNNQREKGYDASYGSGMEMDIDYAHPPPPAATPVYPGQQYAGAPPANYPPATYAPQVHPAAAQYPVPQGYGYPANPPPPTQYSPQPQTSGDRYSAISPPPLAGSYAQDAGAFVHGSNYQTAGGYAAPGPNRIPPAMPHVSAAPSRTYSAPTAGAPVYGTETDPYGYPAPAGNPAPQGFPTDGLYGRGAYTTAATSDPEASSDVLGSPAGTTQRPGYGAPSDAPYDDLQNPALQSATTPTTTAPAQMPSVAAPPARRERERDSEPRERERERDHRDPRARRSEPERDDRHADRNRHRHR